MIPATPTLRSMICSTPRPATPTRAAAASCLESSERLMLADYPVVPLYFFVSKRLVKPYVQGVVANPLNHIRSQALSMQAR